MMDKELYKNELTTYFLNLGIFVQDFASVESTLFDSVKLAANIELSTAKVLLSGAKSDLLRKHLKKLVPDLDQDVISALNHFGEITTFRNKILHNGVDFIPNKFKVTRHKKESGPEIVRIVSGEILKALSKDTKLIGDIITYKYILPAEIKKDETTDLKFNAFVKKRSNELNISWQYKPFKS